MFCTKLLQKGPAKPKDLEKMYQVLVKETDKEMEELRKLLQKQKNEEEQVRDVTTNKCPHIVFKVVDKK